MNPAYIAKDRAGLDNQRSGATPRNKHGRQSATEQGTRASAPTHGEWVGAVAKHCRDVAKLMPIVDLIERLDADHRDNGLLLQHALVHLARAHVDRDDQLDRLRDKLSKIREVLDAEGDQ